MQTSYISKQAYPSVEKCEWQGQCVLKLFLSLFMPYLLSNFRALSAHSCRHSTVPFKLSQIFFKSDSKKIPSTLPVVKHSACQGNIEVMP